MFLENDRAMSQLIVSCLCGALIQNAREWDVLDSCRNSAN